MFSFRTANQLRLDTLSTDRDGKTRLTQEEVTHLHQFVPLAEKWSWGWYETRMHGMRAYHILENYTDPLFRAIRKFSTLDFVPLTDGVDKFDRVKYWPIKHPDHRQLYTSMTAFLREYLGSDPTLVTLMTWLADEPLARHTFAFAVPVCAANAILALAADEPQDAISIARQYVNYFDEAFPPLTTDGVV